jgi:hypothetical protein
MSNSIVYSTVADTPAATRAKTRKAWRGGQAASWRRGMNPVVGYTDHLETNQRPRMAAAGSHCVRPDMGIDRQDVVLLVYLSNAGSYTWECSNLLESVQYVVLWRPIIWVLAALSSRNNDYTAFGPSLSTPSLPSTTLHTRIVRRTVALSDLAVFDVRPGALDSFAFIASRNSTPNQAQSFCEALSASQPAWGLNKLFLSLPSRLFVNYSGYGLDVVGFRAMPGSNGSVSMGN